MDSSKLNSWLQVAANIGIVAGLVLVGLQLKQNSDLLRMQILYDESRRAIELETEVVGERGAEVWAKSIEDPGNLTLAEIRIMEALLWSFIEQLRGTYRLAEQGLLSDADWRKRVESEVLFYLSDPYSLAWWRRFSDNNNNLPEDLRLAVDEVIAADDTHVYDYITAAQRTMEPAPESAEESDGSAQSDAGDSTP